MNLAYIPSAPTRAAVAFDLVTSAANVLCRYWEAGAGAIYAENEALGWFIELLGWPSSAAGCFVAGGAGGTSPRSPRPAMPLWPAAENGRLAAGGWRAPRTCTPPSGSRRACWMSGSSRCLRTRTGTSPAKRWPPRWPTIPTTSLPSWRRPVRRTPDSWTTWRAWPPPAPSTGVWFVHVDGAYGGAGLAAPSVRRLFDGVELADSFIVDPHEWLLPL